MDIGEESIKMDGFLGEDAKSFVGVVEVVKVVEVVVKVNFSFFAGGGGGGGGGSFPGFDGFEVSLAMWCLAGGGDFFDSREDGFGEMGGAKKEVEFEFEGMEGVFFHGGANGAELLTFLDTFLFDGLDLWGELCVDNGMYFSVKFAHVPQLFLKVA